jgi:hypothetical protein
MDEVDGYLIGNNFTVGMISTQTNIGTSNMLCGLFPPLYIRLDSRFRCGLDAKTMRRAHVANPAQARSHDTDPNHSRATLAPIKVSRKSPVSAETLLVVLHQLVGRPEGLLLLGPLGRAARRPLEGGVRARVGGTAEGGVSPVIQLAVGDGEFPDELGNFGLFVLE